MGLFGEFVKSTVAIVEDVTTIVAAPIVIGADITREVTKPLAEAARDIVKAVKDEET